MVNRPKPLGISGDLSEETKKPGFSRASPLTRLFAWSIDAQIRLKQVVASWPDTKAVTLSTQSMPRFNGIVKSLSLQQFVTFSLLTWQLALNMGHLVRLTNTAGSAFVAWYMGCLLAFPVCTKSMTTGGIGLIGDTLAQFVEEKLRSKQAGTSVQFLQRYDRRRGIANTVDGFIIMGPLLHFAYEFLEWLIPVSGAATGMAATIAAITQVLIDDFIFDAFFVGIMFFTTGLGEGYSFRSICKQVRTDFVGTVRTSWATSILLMPIEFVLFRFFPLSVRVLGMNLIDILWEGMVSYLVHRRRKIPGVENSVPEMHNPLEVEALVPVRPVAINMA